MICLECTRLRTAWYAVAERLTPEMEDGKLTDKVLRQLEINRRRPDYQAAKAAYLKHRRMEHEEI